MMKKILPLLMLFFTLSSQSLAELPKTIRFATEATYPPFEYVDNAGQIKGFDIDIAKLLCQEMKVQCTFTNQSFNSLIPSLNLGKFDALIASIGITTERQKQVSFTQSYYEPSASFVAPLSSHFKLTDIAGKTIGVQEGTTFVQYLKAKYPNTVTIKTYASIQDAFLDLVSGRINTVLTDTPIAKTWLKQDNNNQRYGIVGQPIVDHVYFGTGYGIAVRKDDSELLAALNKALDAIKANGSYKALVQQYFGG